MVPACLPLPAADHAGQPCANGAPIVIISNKHSWAPLKTWQVSGSRDSCHRFPVLEKKPGQRLLNRGRVGNSCWHDNMDGGIEG